MSDYPYIVRVFAAALGLMVAAGSLSACNTIAGAGKDVTAVGHATTNTANDVKNGH